LFKHTVKLFIITVLCLACEEDDPVPAPFLEISKEELIQNLGPEGGSRTVTVTANQEYTATFSQPWCAVTVSKNYFVISVSQNESPEQRTAAIIVSSKDLPDITLTMTQAGSSLFLKISETELIQDFEMEGGDKIVTVTTNQKYTVASSYTWCYVAVLNDGFRISVPETKVSNGQPVSFRHPNICRILSLWKHKPVSHWRFADNHFIFYYSLFIYYAQQPMLTLFTEKRKQGVIPSPGNQAPNLFMGDLPVDTWKIHPLRKRIIYLPEVNRRAVCRRRINRFKTSSFHDNEISK